MPARGICRKQCTNVSNTCVTPSATQYQPCISYSSTETGAKAVCAIACKTMFPWEKGKVKTYSCPSGTSCNRTVGSIMQVCTAN
jgi:hypothetical protein